MQEDHTGRQIDSITGGLRWDLRQNSVGWLIEMQRSQVLNTEAAHLRKSVWSASQQSLYIESLILGLPMAPLYLVEEEHGQYFVLDGVQRLRTVLHFSQDEIKLTGLPLLGDLNGYSYSQLGDEERHRLLSADVPAVTLWRGGDPSYR